MLKAVMPLLGNILARIAAGDFAVAGHVGDASLAGRGRRRRLGIAVRADLLQSGLELGLLSCASISSSKISPSTNPLSSAFLPMKGP